MNKKNAFRVLWLFGFIIVMAFALYVSSHEIPVLQPAGEVAEKQRNLIIIGALLSLIVVIPVFTMLFLISWKYREGNPKKTKYDPEWDHSRKIEFTWWAIPSAIILVLAVITWNSSHDLDPFKALRSDTKPLHIQVVALQWRWLFIYPEQDIATVNFVQFPKDTPIDFEITADAPMNSFWIPALGGQIYAMPGMSTHLNLVANKFGDFNGKSANISGEGFSNMTFVARSSSGAEFNNWYSSVKQKNNYLYLDAYNNLALPSKDTAQQTYAGVDKTIYQKIIHKYMHDDKDEHEHTHEMGM